MEALTEYLKANKPNVFKAVPIYSPEGESLTFIFEDAKHYRERIDNFLTVYRAIHAGPGDKNRLVGCQIKGLHETLELLGSFDLTITNEPIKLNMLFLACLAQTEKAEVKHIYIDLAQRDEAKKVEIAPADLGVAA